MSSRSGLPRMWFSARAVSVNGKLELVGGLARRGDARRPRARGSRGGPRGSKSSIEPPTAPAPAARVIAPRGGLGLRAVAVLEVDRHRQARRLVERAHVLGELVERDAAVEAAERERERGAGGGQRLEAQRLEHPGRAGVPRVRDHERLALVQRAEVGRLARLGGHGVVGRHSGSLSVAVRAWSRTVTATRGSARRRRAAAPTARAAGRRRAGPAARRGRRARRGRGRSASAPRRPARRAPARAERRGGRRAGARR